MTAAVLDREESPNSKTHSPSASRIRAVRIQPSSANERRFTNTFRPKQKPFRLAGPRDFRSIVRIRRSRHVPYESRAW